LKLTVLEKNIQDIVEHIMVPWDELNFQKMT